jgi:hypothetical protein
VLNDEEMDVALAAAGLKRLGFLDEGRAWVKARVE